MCIISVSTSWTVLTLLLLSKVPFECVYLKEGADARGSRLCSGLD